MSVTEALLPIRERAHLPALVGAIVDSQGLVANGVVGVRKVGIDVEATTADDWHLGSDTKGMTGTLIGLLIDDGRIKFETSIGDIFPDLSAGLPDAFRKVTVAELLAHRSGLPGDVQLGPMAGHGSLTAQRINLLKAVADAKFVAGAGAKYNYSNWGYVILGAISECISGRPWEALLEERVCLPLKMKHVGFGGTGTPGKVDQPWPHQGGKPMPSNGPAVDNHAALAPAGAVHCPIGEWAKFIANELRGMRGEPNLLSPATFGRLHAPEFGGNYACGWAVGERDWAKGAVYIHMGSNTINFAGAWIAPKRNVAFLICTNDASVSTSRSLNDAMLALLRVFDKNAP